MYMAVPIRDFSGNVLQSCYVRTVGLMEEHNLKIFTRSFKIADLTVQLGTKPSFNLYELLKPYSNRKQQ